jgi:NAD(P)-dependent dehydrogenase (short-subunit alcohol dehydrogenase family)
MRLAGKSLVIIGGTTGIGYSAAKTFVAEGARVVAMGRRRDTVEEAQQRLGENAHVFVWEASDFRGAPLAIEKALDLFGRFDGLYHVAGGSGRHAGDGPLHELTDQGWDYTLNQNLTSVFLSNRAATQQFLKQQSGGTILNMSSVLGFSPSPKFFSTHAYATAKAAIVGLTTSAAAHYASQNIRFNALAPGLIATPMSQRAQGDEAILNFIKSKQPLDGGRIGQPNDLDSAAVFFMSDESKFVTGQVLAVDGGWSVSEA